MADPQQDAPARASSGSSSASSPYVLPGERSQYPVNMAVDFTRLRPNALRKYLAFHGIPEVPGSSREQLAVTVARHFNQECKKADEGSSITSFVTYLTGSSDTVEAAQLLRARPVHRLKRKKYDYDFGNDDKENQSRQVTISNGGNMEAVLAEEDVDNLYDYGQEDGAGLGGELRPFVVKKRRPASQDKKSRGGNGRGRAESGDAGMTQKKKKRKGRLYCTCKGASFGNMIACDNKKCLDRSNWYHMGCVGLDPLEEPPETWYCPACQENDSADIPENQYRKPVASVTYGDMIAHALTVLPGGKGSFKEICDFVETEYESQLNWKLESDQRKSPVWKSSVRKILFSNVRFRKHPEAKGLFCLAA
ncbi:Chromatin modification-related protein YNG2 [Phytophthora cinnamomi]|uniref:Chromatin modification-related protein YNG2 n=1 Tax=Phytophthora cinnamomi TaxID=4785 RepID=UPI00355ABED6|nr:Chromatin modification-related protein YNG2 [Phytophthora cinnamomi]